MVPKAKRTAKARQRTRPAARSSKAGTPPLDMVTRPRVKRRQRSAHIAYRKDAVIQESTEGPYRIWGISRPKEKTTERRRGRRR